MLGRQNVDIKSETRLFDDFFKVDEVIVSYEKYDGNMSAYDRRLIFERGDSVAALLFNVDTNSVVLVEQFKVASLVGRRRDNPTTKDGWIVEVMAGMIRPNETAEQAVIRETLEETGYEIRNPEPICKFFSSPGGTSERILVYFAKVNAASRVSRGGGVADEDVRLVELGVNDLFQQLALGAIEDPKLAIAAYWLHRNIVRVETLEPNSVQYQLKGQTGLTVGYKEGPLDYVKGVSIWVNSENTDMMMDRVIGQSISAKIRYLGANKNDFGNVVDDPVQEGLRALMGSRTQVKVGNVLVTESGMLNMTHQVQRIFHVAAVEGGPDATVKADPIPLEKCLNNILERVERENKKLWRWISGRTLDSILIPMMGSGDGGLPVNVVARSIIPAAMKYFKSTPDPSLKAIYFLAFRNRDKSACEDVLRRYCEEGILEPVGRS